jgi:hypothetical protein
MITYIFLWLFIAMIGFGALKYLADPDYARRSRTDSEILRTGIESACWAGFFVYIALHWGPVA